MTVREAIWDRLSRLGVAEMHLHALMLTLDTWDIPDETARQAELGRTVLWIAMTPKQVQRHDARLEAFGKVSNSAPMVRFASPADVMSDPTNGWFGLALNIADVMREKGRL